LTEVTVVLYNINERASFGVIVGAIVCAVGGAGRSSRKSQRSPDAVLKREDGLECGPTVVNRIKLKRQGEGHTGARSGGRTKRASHERNVIYSELKHCRTSVVSRSVKLSQEPFDDDARPVGRLWSLCLVTRCQEASANVKRR
jgi:hypothetical protein